MMYVGSFLAGLFHSHHIEKHSNKQQLKCKCLNDFVIWQWICLQVIIFNEYLFISTLTQPTRLRAYTTFYTQKKLAGDLALSNIFMVIHVRMSYYLKNYTKLPHGYVSYQTSLSESTGVIQAAEKLLTINLVDGCASVNFVLCALIIFHVVYNKVKYTYGNDK